MNSKQAQRREREQRFVRWRDAAGVQTPIGRGSLGVVLCGVLLLGACGASSPPRVKDPLLVAQDRRQPQGERVQAAREAIARAGDDSVAQETVWRELSDVAWSATDDDAVRAGALAALLSVQNEGAKRVLREGLVRSLGDERDPSIVHAGAELAAREGWSDAVPALTLAIARPSLFATNGRQDAGPRAVQSATISFGGIGNDGIVQRNVQAGTVLPRATSAEAIIAAKRALSELIVAEGGVQKLWQYVIAPQAAPQVVLKDPQVAKAAQAAERKTPEDAEPQAKATALALTNISAATSKLAAARATERLRIAAYDVLAKQGLNGESAITASDAGKVWRDVSIAALVQSSDAQLPVVALLRRAQEALGTLPATGEEFAQLLSIPTGTEADARWWASVRQARKERSVRVGMAEVVRWASEFSPSEAVRAKDGSDLPWEDELACQMLREVFAQPETRRALKQQLALDRNDRRAVYGGWIVSQAARSESGDRASESLLRISSPRPSERQGDFTFVTTQEMLNSSGQAIAWYRLSAQRENNSDRSEPDDRDRWIVTESRRPYVVVTSVAENRARVVYVMAQQTVDLGEFALDGERVTSAK